MNQALINQITADDQSQVFVFLKFKNVFRIKEMISNPNDLMEYIEQLSHYKLTSDIVMITNVDLIEIEVQIKCPNEGTANLFFMNLKFISQDSGFEVYKKRLSNDALISETLQFIENGKQKLLDEHASKVNSLQALIPTSKNKTFVSIDKFEQQKLLKQVYGEKINELMRHEEEFKRASQFIKKCLNFYKDNHSISSIDIDFLRKSFEREVCQFKAALPIYAHKSKIIQVVTNEQVTILIGETGSGKTTQIIQYLFEAWSRSNGIIVCTQPRKVAAMSIAMRVAEEMKVKLGGLVGYQVGMNCKKSQETRLLFVTDHMLLNECMRDREFKKYVCIILDEAHERSIYTDLLLGFIKRALQTRSDLRVVVTSATIDPDVFVKFFTDFYPPVLRVSGRVFPVDTFYEEPTDTDHVKNAYLKAAELHRSEPIPGDILVFLTSPVETEQAVKKLKSMNLTNVFVLPLHGQLQVSQQKEALALTKTNMRKIVFATNAAETSVTIPGIKYVIDPGYVKEVTFDSEKNMNTLVITRTTQSSADQRKGRAGRTQSGKCYRLYTEGEFKMMKKNSVPEILRAHLGQSMLKLMILGVPNPRKFEFVEAPPAVTIESALKLLEELGAIDEGGVTEVGRKLACINLEPRLGKVTLLGIEQGLGYESIVICALCSTGNQVFFRGGSEEDKSKSDLKKTIFCDDYGDLLTLLNVYKKWEATSPKERIGWCLQNSINSKRISGTKEIIDEIIHSFNSELRINIHRKFSNVDNITKRIAKIIFDCFLSNLTRNTGHRKTGFRMVNDPKLPLQIHPSSSLTYIEHPPKWIVFQSLLTTSEKFMMNVTYIDDTWIAEAINRGILTFSEADVDKVVMGVRELPRVGTNIQKILFSKNDYRNRSAIESKISALHPDINAILDLNNAPQLFLYASSFAIELSYDVALDQIKSMKNDLFNENLIEPIRSSSNVKFVMGAGMEVTDLMLGGEYINVVVKTNCPDDFCKSKIEFYFTNLKHFKCFRNIDKDNFILTFSTSEEAKKYVQKHERGPNVCYITDVQPQLMKSNTISTCQNFSVKVSMNRRALKPFGFIEFEYVHQCQNFLDHCSSLKLKFRKFLCEIFITENRKRPFQVKMVGIPFWTTTEMVEKAIDGYVAIGSVKKIILIRSQPPSDEDKKRQKEQLEGFINICLSKRAGLTKSYKISISDPPNNKAFVLNAYVNFSEHREAEKAVELIDGLLVSSIPDEHLIASLELKQVFFTPKLVYEKFEKDVDKILKQFEKKSYNEIKKTIRPPSDSWKDYVITIKVETSEDLCNVTGELVPYLKGIPYNTKHFGAFIKMKDAIYQITKQFNTFARFDYRQKVIFIHGHRPFVDATLAELLAVVSQPSNTISREISLRNSKFPKGLMKKLIIDCGCNMEMLKKECGADIKLHLKKYIIVFEGDEESFNKLEKILDNIAATVERRDDDDDNSSGIEELGNCPICMDRVHKDNCFVAEYCQHVYCIDCANNLVKNNIQQIDFPMKCIVENCDKPFILRDLQFLLPPDEFGKVRDFAIRSLLSKNPDRYSYCPTPDCPIVFPKTIAPEEFVCSECGISVCRSCGSNDHFGMTCAVYKIYHTSADKDFKRWLEEDKVNRSVCPKCNSGIEKNGGCSHVECTICKIHICWKCKQTFGTSIDCYTHMSSIHGGNM